MFVPLPEEGSADSKGSPAHPKYSELLRLPCIRSCPCPVDGNSLGIGGSPDRNPHFLRSGNVLRVCAFRSAEWSEIPYRATYHCDRAPYKRYPPIRTSVPLPLNDRRTDRSCD